MQRDHDAGCASASRETRSKAALDAVAKECRGASDRGKGEKTYGREITGTQRARTRIAEPASAAALDRRWGNVQRVAGERSSSSMRRPTTFSRRGTGAARAGAP